MTSKTIFTDPLSVDVWNRTYRYGDEPTVDDTFNRAAIHCANIEKNQQLRTKWTKKFNSIMTNFGFVPGGRILANIGTKFTGTSLHNCFISPLIKFDVDSIEGIYTTLMHQAMTLKSEGGWGFNFGVFGPRGRHIRGSGAESPGIVSWMELFDKSSDVLTRGSGNDYKNSDVKKKIRKGAQMAICPDWHPDVIEFIVAKQTPNYLTKFNMSVALSNEFMERYTTIEIKKEVINSYNDLIKSVPQDEVHDEVVSLYIDRIEQLERDINTSNIWLLEYPDTKFDKYKTEWDGNLNKWKAAGYPVIVYNETTVIELFDIITENTYKRNEPGILFLDRAQQLNTFWYGDNIFASNPCGEQLMSDGNVCNVGNTNVAAFCEFDGTKFVFNRDKFIEAVKTSVRYLDNIIDVAKYPLPEYEKNSKEKRRIGTGLFGIGSALYLLKLKYGSKEAIAFCNSFCSDYAVAAYEASIDLAVEKGMFPLCNPLEHASGIFINRLNLSKEYMEKLLKRGIRNSAVLSFQPTGNGSSFANVVSSGMEPVFSKEYDRWVIMDVIPEDIKDVTPNFFKNEFFETSMFKFEKRGDDDVLVGTSKNGNSYMIDKNRGLTMKYACKDFAIRLLDDYGIRDQYEDVLVTAEDLTVQEHIDMLSVFAYWVDSSISKTINVPNDYPYSDFKKVYLEAFKGGNIKGLTTYRSGTMMAVLETSSNKEIIVEDEIVEEMKLADTLPAARHVVNSEGKKWYIHITLDEDNNRPVEIFVDTNAREKNIKHSTTTVISQLLAFAQEKGVHASQIESIQQKIDNTTAYVHKLCKVLSLILRHGIHIKNLVKELDKIDCDLGSTIFHIRKILSSYIKDGEKVDGESCQNCGSTMIVYEDGCKTCKNCGSSKCG